MINVLNKKNAIEVKFLHYHETLKAVYRSKTKIQLKNLKNAWYIYREKHNKDETNSVQHPEIVGSDTHSIMPCINIFWKLEQSLRSKSLSKATYSLLRKFLSFYQSIYVYIYYIQLKKKKLDFITSRGEDIFNLYYILNLPTIWNKWTYRTWPTLSPMILL